MLQPALMAELRSKSKAVFSTINWGCLRDVTSLWVHVLFVFSVFLIKLKFSNYLFISPFINTWNLFLECNSCDVTTKFLNHRQKLTMRRVKMFFSYYVPGTTKVFCINNLVLCKTNRKINEYKLLLILLLLLLIANVL